MRARLFLVVLPLLAVLAAPAWAEDQTLDRILPDIRAAHPGRLSDAQPWTDDEGRPHYRIKWMTPEGRIQFFDADARTGRYTAWQGDRGWMPSAGHERERGEEGATPAHSDDRPRRHDNWNGDANPFPGGWSHGREDRHGGGDWRGGKGDNGGWRHDDRGGN